MRFLWVTLILLAVFAVIVWQTCRPGNRDRFEEPRHRMLDDD